MTSRLLARKLGEGTSASGCWPMRLAGVATKLRIRRGTTIPGDEPLGIEGLDCLARIVNEVLGFAVVWQRKGPLFASA
jgi:hypothetical protein